MTPIKSFKVLLQNLCVFVPSWPNKKGRLTPALIFMRDIDNYFCFSSMASRVCVAEVTIGVPGPKIFEAPAA